MYSSINSLPLIIEINFNDMLALTFPNTSGYIILYCGTIFVIYLKKLEL